MEKILGKTLKNKSFVKNYHRHYKEMSQAGFEPGNACTTNVRSHPYTVEDRWKFAVSKCI